MGPVHDGLTSLLHELPEWVAEVLAHHGQIDVNLEPERMRTEATYKRPDGKRVEIRADAVTLLWPPGVPRTVANRRRLTEIGCVGTLGEIQTGYDEDRVDTWQAFCPAFRKHLGRHIFLVPIALTEELADQFREELAFKITAMRVFVVSPSKVPRIDDPDPVTDPHRTLLNAMFHVRSMDDLPLLRAAKRAVEEFEPELKVLYTEMLESHIEESIMSALSPSPSAEEEVLNRYPGYEPSERELKSYLYVRGERRGVAIGQAQAVVKLLRLRGLSPTPEVEQAILGCRDAEQLERWFERALVIDRADALLDD